MNKTPLHSATENDIQEVGELLLSNGADIYAIDIIHLNIIIFFLIKIIDKKQRKLYSKNKTMLHYAAMNNAIWMGEKLLSRGVDIDAIDIIYINIIILLLIKIIKIKLRKFHKKNCTALHIAAANNSKEIGELLISNGADINAIDIVYLKIIVFFLMNIIDKKLRKLNRKNKTMLHYAAKGNSLWMVELQISKGADVNVIDL